MPDHGLNSEEEIVAWRLKMMTTQRFTNLMDLADIIGDMGPDGIEILRKLGDSDNKNMRKFLREAKPETFDFLAGLRKEEVGELGNAIENARALRRSGKLVRNTAIAVAGGFVTFAAAGDKLADWWHWFRSVK